MSAPPSSTRSSASPRRRPRQAPRPAAKLSPKSSTPRTRPPFRLARRHGQEARRRARHRDRLALRPARSAHPRRSARPHRAHPQRSPLRRSRRGALPEARHPRRAPTRSCRRCSIRSRCSPRSRTSRSRVSVVSGPGIHAQMSPISGWWPVIPSGSVAWPRRSRGTPPTGPRIIAKLSSELSSRKTESACIERGNALEVAGGRIRSPLPRAPHAILGR